MTSPRRARGALMATAAATAMALSLTACSADEGSDAAEDSVAATTAAGTTEPVDTTPFGAGCGQLPVDPATPGSLASMASQPVGTAAAANPLLSTLGSVIGQATLVDALNAQPAVTVLAPANSAFDAVPADQLNTLLADVPQLTTVLQHHVINGRLAPDELAGDHTTLLGDTVTIAGSGEAFTVSAEQTLLGAADANVVCGNVQTQNATVYIIDQVLSPEA